MTRLVRDKRIAAGPIAALAVDPGDELVACAGERNRSYSIAVWTLDGERVWANGDVVPTQGRDRLAWSTDGKLLAVACGDGTIRVFDRGGARIATLGPGRKRKAAMAVAFAPSGELVSGGFDAIARVWQLAFLADGHLAALSFNPDTKSSHSDLKLWDLATRKPVVEIEAPRTSYSLAVTRTGVVLGRTGFDGYNYVESLGGIEIWKRG